MNNEYPGVNYYGINSISKVTYKTAFFKKQWIEILDEHIKKRKKEKCKNKKLKINFEGD